MVTVLQNHLSKTGSNQRIKDIEYRNLAPVYAEEEMKICGREKEGGKGEWEVWVEGIEGGYAVRGNVKTERI